jgi:chemotaxis protein methyltransferase WspC
VPETWFFRGGPIFARLAQQARAAGMRSPGRVFRVLSAPCSTGEEPYSMALALFDAGVPPASWAIDAIDLSRRALERARRGVYGEPSFREPGLDRARHFRPAPGGWEIDPAVRAAVRFRRGNLLDPGLLAGEGPYDVIFCRNLLIYLTPEARGRVLVTLDRLLRPAGLLCTGPAEALAVLGPRFRPAGPAGSFLFRRASLVPDRGPALGAAMAVGPREPARPNPPAAPAPDGLARARRQADAGDLEAALASCRAHLDTAGPSADLYSLLGVIRQARREEAEAADCFRKALYLDPCHGEALTHLMLLCRQRGQEAEADLLRRRLRRLAAEGGEP